MNESRRKVLLVDDNRVIRHLLSMTFSTTSQFEVFQADCSEQALPIVIREHPEIIILDIMMPGELNGLEVCKMIKSWEDCKDSKIILVSACGQEDDVKQGMAAGADDYIIKPFSPRNLLNTVEQLLAGN